MGRTRPGFSFVMLCALLILPAAPAFAQRLDPVQWSFSIEPVSAAPGAKVLARLTAKIDSGFHLYSLSTPPGPIPTTLAMQDNPVVAKYAIYQPPPHIAFDPNFKADLETFENEVVFLLPLELAKAAPAGPAELAVQTRYQACDARQCLLPVRKTATARLTIEASAATSAPGIPSEYRLFEPGKPAGNPTPVAAANVKATAPSAVQNSGEVQGVGAFILIAFGFGLASVFTPCVFPMIPITVSYFLKEPSGSRRRSISQAFLFSGGIIVLFSSMGLLTTAMLGPFGAVQLGGNPWVSAFIAAVFLAFGLSMLGAFEIMIPSSVLTRADQASGQGGVLGPLLMGLTFSLSAFACVGPFVGTLLAGSVASGGWRPLIGMMAFATGLALPFFGLALFPSFLAKLPKSGGWMARVKTVMGFVILAAMLKYVSNVDAILGWNFLTRERFLALWVVLFALPGLYLLGFLRMEGIRADETVGIPRLMSGMLFLAFALSLIPGMLGGRLGEIDAYVPIGTPQASVNGSGATTWMKNEYQEALDRGRRENKLVFLSFTGYACTNCHWMKSNMFPRPEIAAALGDFILVELYTDGIDAASEANQQILSEKFATTAIPFYAIVDSTGREISRFPGLTRDSAEFLKFLHQLFPDRSQAP
jgi:thiol:disulfide interchange protein